MCVVKGRGSPPSTNGLTRCVMAVRDGGQRKCRAGGDKWWRVERAKGFESMSEGDEVEEESVGRAR